MAQLKIQMVDTRNQYHRIKQEIDAAISAVIDSSQFIMGPSVAEFERNTEKYLGSKKLLLFWVQGRYMLILMKRLTI